jgi:hypothetical protein
MATKQETLRRWQELVEKGSSPPWTSEEKLLGFFQHFRPDGAGLEAVFAGIERGDEILLRLLQAFEATSRSEGLYFIPTPARQPTEEEVQRWLRAHLQKLREIAESLEDEEAVGLFEVGASLEFVSEDLPSTETGDDIETYLLDVVIDFKMQRVESHALLLREAMYLMGTTYAIPDYVLWPLYRDLSKVEDPFLPAFELWKMGVDYQFQDRDRIAVRIAPPHK